MWKDQNLHFYELGYTPEIHHGYEKIAMFTAFSKPIILCVFMLVFGGIDAPKVTTEVYDSISVNPGYLDAGDSFSHGQL